MIWSIFTFLMPGTFQLVFLIANLWNDELFIKYFYYRDNVDWDEEQETVAKEKVEQNSQVTLSKESLQSLEDEADKHWDAFYDIHQNK